MTDIVQIKAKDLKRVREEILLSQEGKCAICGITAEESGRTFHLDHDHDTGKIRGVLCYACNHQEASIMRGIKNRYARRDSLGWTNPLLFLHYVLEYWKKEQHPMIHPTYSIELGRQKPKKRKARKRKSK